MEFDEFASFTVNVEGIDINCRIGGSGPPVLLLHGYPQNLAMWAVVAPLLSSARTVVCADLRGYGDSAKPLADESTYSFRSMAADQVRLMRSFGFEHFDVVGHDRGARTAHRLALDEPAAVRSLTVLDIAPTLDMLTSVDRHSAAAYWHWYFLSLAEPFPERLIAADPDYFFETCFTTWGATDLGALNPHQVAEYQRCWRSPDMIRASCADYRATVALDLVHDQADADVQVRCPTLAMWGADGRMAKIYDLESLWRRRCSDLRCAAVPGGHFFVDQAPERTAKIITEFLAELDNKGSSPGCGRGDTAE